MTPDPRDLFPDEPRRVAIDERDADLVFEAKHAIGGTSRATVLVPAGAVDDPATVELARRRATESCLRHGAGTGISVAVHTAI